MTALDCQLEQATSKCSKGKCEIDKCDPGFDDCNHDAADGCEIDLTSDGDNCGDCKKVCGPGKQCTEGKCQ
ncbi:MAG: hypothetical protein R3B70_42220 [Polyangiaceae bacterium]